VQTFRGRYSKINHLAASIRANRPSRVESLLQRFRFGDQRQPDLEKPPCEHQLVELRVLALAGGFRSREAYFNRLSAL
jgi:hypothetical protein